MKLDLYMLLNFQCGMSKTNFVDWDVGKKPKAFKGSNDGSCDYFLSKVIEILMKTARSKEQVSQRDDILIQITSEGNEKIKNYIQPTQLLESIDYIVHRFPVIENKELSILYHTN